MIIWIASELMTHRSKVCSLMEVRNPIYTSYNDECRISLLFRHCHPFELTLSISLSGIYQFLLLFTSIPILSQIQIPQVSETSNPASQIFFSTCDDFNSSSFPFQWIILYVHQENDYLLSVFCFSEYINRNCYLICGINSKSW